MRTQLVVTDLTLMHEDRICVAGYMEGGACVRPVCDRNHLRKSWLVTGTGQIVRPFTLISLDFLRNEPQPPHAEDWVIRPQEPSVVGLLSSDEQMQLLTRLADPSVASIFGAKIHSGPGYYVRAGEGSRSLGTVKPMYPPTVTYRLYDGKWDYRISFVDQAGDEYRLSVVDMAFRYRLDELSVRARKTPHEAELCLDERLAASQVWLRVGLARGWQKFPDRCYLQITGVYTFPDYLDGRCWVDLALRPEELARRQR